MELVAGFDALVLELPFTLVVVGFFDVVILVLEVVGFVDVLGLELVVVAFIEEGVVFVEMELPATNFASAWTDVTATLDADVVSPLGPGNVALGDEVVACMTKS